MMDSAVKKVVSMLLTYLSAMIFVLAVFSVPVSVGPISEGWGQVAFADGDGGGGGEEDDDNNSGGNDDDCGDNCEAEEYNEDAEYCSDIPAYGDYYYWWWSWGGYDC